MTSDGDTNEKRAHPLLGARVDKYQIQEVLGQGGMGVVFRARQEIIEPERIAFKNSRRGKQPFKFAPFVWVAAVLLLVVALVSMALLERVSFAKPDVTEADKLKTKEKFSPDGHFRYADDRQKLEKPGPKAVEPSQSKSHPSQSRADKVKPVRLKKS